MTSSSFTISGQCPLCKHITDDIEIGKCEGCKHIVYDINNVTEEIRLKMKGYGVKAVCTTVIDGNIFKYYHLLQETHAVYRLKVEGFHPVRAVYAVNVTKKWNSMSPLAPPSPLSVTINTAIVGICVGFSCGMHCNL